MSLVEKGLYIGNINHATDVRWLKNHNITHIVNATEEIGNIFPYLFQYMKLFLDDSPHQSFGRSLDKSYIFIKNALHKGGNVLVHCYAGVSRSSSIVIYYLMRSRNWSYSRAYAHLKIKHHKTNPNRGFIDQLSRINFSKANKLQPDIYGSSHFFRQPTDIVSYY